MNRLVYPEVTHFLYLLVFAKGRGDEIIWTDLLDSKYVVSEGGHWLHSSVCERFFSAEDGRRCHANTLQPVRGA